MDTKEIILITVILIFVGLRLYQKYAKKNQSDAGSKTASGSPSSSSAGDDYEPYSKK
jgi:Tfp pilus assembly major pilin PilA